MSNWIEDLKALLTTIDTVADAIKAVTDNLPNSGALNDLASILEDTGTTIPGTITTLQSAVTGIQNDLDNATDGLGALKALIDAVQTDATAILEDTGTTIPGILTTIAGYIDAEVQAIIDDLANATDGLGALKAIMDTTGVLVNARTAAFEKLVGVLQTKATTIDLQQVAGDYDLFTGTTQDVMLEKLVIRLPNVDVSDDATITSISIQTDDVTPQVIIDATAGAVGNLTAEAQLAWTGAILIKTGTKIQLTIAGGAADAPTVCDVVAECRAVLSGGYLA